MTWLGKTLSQKLHSASGPKLTGDNMMFSREDGGIAPLIDDLRFGLWGKLITNPPDGSLRLADSTSGKRGLQREGPPGYIGAGLSRGGVDSTSVHASRLHCEDTSNEMEKNWVDSLIGVHKERGDKPPNGWVENGTSSPHAGNGGWALSI